MEKIRLANGNTFEIEYGASEQKVSMLFDNAINAATVIEAFTKENLSKIEFLTEAGEVCGVYENKELGVADFEKSDEKWLVTFWLEEVIPTSDEILRIILGGEL